MVGLFGLVAVATAHEHWLKERADVVAITGPLNAWIDQLPSKTLKRLEKNLAPALLVVGVATVVGPDIVLEMRLRDTKRARFAVPQSQPGSAPAGSFGYEAAGGPVPAANGAGFAPRSGSGGWHNSVPANPQIGSEWDV